MRGTRAAHGASCKPSNAGKARLPLGEVLKEELVHPGEEGGASLAKANEPSLRTDGVIAAAVLGAWYSESPCASLSSPNG